MCPPAYRVTSTLRLGESACKLLSLRSSGLKESAPPAAECSLTLLWLDTGTGQISSPQTLTNGVHSSRIERVLPKEWACGAAGSALPWHGRGHRFDPDQVHQIIQAFRSTSFLRVVGNLGANSKTTPRTGFAGTAAASAAVSSVIAIGIPRTSFLDEPFATFPVRGVIGGSGAGDVPAFFDNSAWIASSVVRTPGRRTCI